ncbi:M20 family metallo-hydrolase [Chitinophagaceae bacterium LB-8]|uniref:M20 family metallo-hydrolase n=1 Tax=Paraflavisolibacter caeni TaxID=2982496 RepID=A0A9X2XTJ6_9BACT|nr:M20 family metallo-hydrolase [Paraflavisolibacter caeni]MCU7548087.1 M20 family metallo-hydrolase [Paraflavisolibacter caeni]
MINDQNKNTRSNISPGDESRADPVISLLKQLIALPSFSKEEENTAAAIEAFLHTFNVPSERYLNNVWAKNKYFDASKPTILLNSHHDTVKPNKGYTLDPFAPIEKDGKLFGLGSNDAGGALVSLLALFLHYYNQQELKYNLVYAATAEEEISGKNGIEALLRAPEFLQSVGAGAKNPFVAWCAIVGEPTLMQLAVAERGLMVLDCMAQGRAGHAARNEGENAIYKALKDIEWFQSYQFPKVSDLLGPVKMSVTVIETENKAHNVVPAQCKFVVDIRVNELYTFEEVLDIIRSNVQCDAKPRSTRLRSSGIPLEHPLVQAGIKLGRTYYGSPTTSDKALMPFVALKMGPGDSARSHTADEFIYIDEIKEGIDLYIKLLNQVL